MEQTITKFTPANDEFPEEDYLTLTLIDGDHAMRVEFTASPGEFAANRFSIRQNGRSSLICHGIVLHSKAEPDDPASCDCDLFECCHLYVIYEDHKYINAFIAGGKEAVFKLMRQQING